MKRILAFFVAFSVLATSFAATTTLELPKKLRADEIFLPYGKDGKMVSLADLSTMSLKDLRKMTGKKMSLVEKASIKAAQSKIRESINDDGTLDTQKLQKYAKKTKGGETGFHLGGFALGFFLGLIGVLVAYLLKDDYRRNRIKWAWLGLLIAVVLNVVIIIAIL